MERVTIDCGNGWQVRVSVVDGTPFITAEHVAGDMLSAGSASVRLAGCGVEFADWHPTEHDTDG
jgi:hypothetical protein